MCASGLLSDGPLRPPIAIGRGCDAPGRSTTTLPRILTLSFRFVDELDDTVVGQGDILSAEMCAENWVEVGKFELESALPAGVGIVRRHEQGPVASDSTQRLHAREPLRRRRKLEGDEFVVVIERHGRWPSADSEDVIDGGDRIVNGQAVVVVGDGGMVLEGMEMRRVWGCGTRGCWGLLM